MKYISLFLLLLLFACSSGPTPEPEATPQEVKPAVPAAEVGEKPPKESVPAVLEEPVPAETTPEIPKRSARDSDLRLTLEGCRALFVHQCASYTITIENRGEDPA